MADFPANNDRCGDHHQVLDNILPFQREHERKCPKYLPGEEDDGQKGARHMQEEQHQGHAEQWLVDKAEANGHLPDAKDVDESGDREPGHGLDHECSRWAHPQELERSEPKEHDSHADAQEEQPVFFHPRSETELDLAEDFDWPLEPMSHFTQFHGLFSHVIPDWQCGNVRRRP
jgi:hypothetical protein